MEGAATHAGLLIACRSFLKLGGGDGSSILLSMSWETYTVIDKVA
jgi:hypothetical protein